MAILTPMNFDADSSGPPPVGNYPARIISCEEKASAKSGDIYQLWRLELFGSPQISGRQVSMMTTDGRKGVSGEPVAWGLGRLKQLYKASTGETLTENMAFDTDSILSREVTVSLAHRNYTDNNGDAKVTAEVKAITSYK